MQVWRINIKKYLKNNRRNKMKMTKVITYNGKSVKTKYYRPLEWQEPGIAVLIASALILVGYLIGGSV